MWNLQPLNQFNWGFPAPLPPVEAGFTVSRADRSISVDHREARGVAATESWGVLIQKETRQFEKIANQLINKSID